MMDATSQDMHMCLSCHSTIIGLMNYVQHKQNGCQPSKTSSAAQALTTLNTFPQAIATETILKSDPTEKNKVSIEEKSVVAVTTEGITINRDVDIKKNLDSGSGPSLGTVAFQARAGGETMGLMPQPVVSEGITPVRSQPGLPVQIPLPAEPSVPPLPPAPPFPPPPTLPPPPPPPTLPPLPPLPALPPDPPPSLSPPPLPPSSPPRPPPPPPIHAEEPDVSMTEADRPEEDKREGNIDEEKILEDTTAAAAVALMVEEEKAKNAKVIEYRDKIEEAEVMEEDDNDEQKMDEAMEEEEIVVSPEKEDIEMTSNGRPSSPIKSGENFFHSLELQSKKDDVDRNISPGKSQKTIKGSLEKSSSNNHSDLPISNIFSSLEFSSDEDFDFSYPEISSDSNEYSSEEDDAPPRTHTGGKWKPGQGPSSCKTFPHPGYTGGKWKPGETPLEVQLKNGADILKSTEDATTTSSDTTTNTNTTTTTTNTALNEIDAEKESPELDSTLQMTNQDEAKSSQKENHCSECNSNDCEHIANTAIEVNEEPTSKELGDVNKTPKVQRAKKRRKLPDEATKEPVHHCQVCDKDFFSKYVIGRHILTRYHQNRAKTHPDGFRMLEKYYRFVIRLCPFQCNICQFYFNREKDLLDHMNTSDHLQNCLGLVGPMFCTVCNLKLPNNTIMISHLMSDEQHRQSLERQKQLCVVKECRYQIQCPFCDIILHSSVRLRRHIRYKHKNGKQVTVKETSQTQHEEPFKPECPKCHMKCQSMSALDIHIRRRHTKEKPYACRICDKAFSDNYSLRLHMKSDKHKKKTSPEKFKKRKHKKKKFYPDLVPLDSVRFESDEEPLSKKTSKPKKKKKRRANGETLRIVVKPSLKKKKPRVRSTKEKAPPKIHKCEHCDFTAQTYGDLRPHYLDMHSEFVSLCTVCDLVFLSEKALRVHYSGRMHQTNLQKMDKTDLFTCRECGRRFHDERWCQFHIEMHHNHLNNEEAVRLMYQGNDITSVKYRKFLKSIEEETREKIIDCPDCPKKLKRDHVLEHLRMHTGEKPYVCRFCQNGFISSLSLRRHILRHLGLTERKCQICGKEFQKIFSYNLHMKQHEDPETKKNKHKCDVCLQTFSLKSQLVAHTRRHGQRTHKCPYPDCKWDFVFKSELNSHLRTHTGEKPFLCDICGYSGATRTRLARHVRIHTGERTYHCDYCTYKAGNSTHLRRHMRIHIGTKPYKCPYCPYTCNTHENIRKHIIKTKRHEGMFIYPCKFCPFGTNNTKDFRHHLLEAHSDQCDYKSLEVLSAFTGLYDQELDLRKPPEGSQIIPIKERKQRVIKGVFNEQSFMFLDDEEIQLIPDDDEDKASDDAVDADLSMIAAAISESAVETVSEVNETEQIEAVTDHPHDENEEQQLCAIQNTTIIEHPQLCTENLTNAHFQTDGTTIATQTGDPNTANVLSIPENPAISSSLDLGYCTTIEYICLQTPNGT